MKSCKQLPDFRLWNKGLFRGLLACLLLPHAASAAPLIWDIDSHTAGVQDGNGTWNASNTHWWDEASQRNVSFESASLPTLEFRGSGNPASSVTFQGSEFNVGGLTFTSELSRSTAETAIPFWETRR